MFVSFKTSDMISLALRHASGELMAVRKELMERIPGECINEDEYIAVTVVKKVFKVKFVHDAVMSVDAPENILEYLGQRVRWTTGHLQLRDLTGEPSTVAHFYFLYNPLFVARLLAGELKANPNAFFFWSICALLEAFVFLYVTAKRVLCSARFGATQTASDARNSNSDRRFQSFRVKCIVA